QPAMCSATRSRVSSSSVPSTYAASVSSDGNGECSVVVVIFPPTTCALTKVPVCVMRGTGRLVFRPVHRNEDQIRMAVREEIEGLSGVDASAIQLLPQLCQQFVDALVKLLLVRLQSGGDFRHGQAMPETQLQDDPVLGSQRSKAFTQSPHDLPGRTSALVVHHAIVGVLIPFVVGKNLIRHHDRARRTGGQQRM